MGSQNDDQQLTIQQLVAAVVDAYDDDFDCGDEFVRSLYIAHQWLTDSCSLLSAFIDEYQDSQDGSVRNRVCVAVADWIRWFPMQFDGQPQLCSLVVRLRTISEEVPDEIRAALDVSNLPSYAWLRALSVRNPIARQVQFKVSLSFEQWSPEDISTSLSHIDYKVLSRITIIELKKYVTGGNLKETPLLERSISIFNNLSNWVQCMVLSKSLPKERADIITKFVKVGKHLRRLNNFNTLMSVIGGVTHSNITRLSKTLTQLSPDIKKELSNLTNLLSVQNNFGEYRKALSAAGKNFKIPIIGVHLKDLVALHCCGTDFAKTKTTTKGRVHRLANSLSNFLIFDPRSPNIPEANLDLINTLKVSLDIRYNEDDIYELSLRREPRTFMNFDSPSRPLVFAEWASGVSATPDPDTVNKHITAMVDAVFKHYDHDRDGYISQAEFLQISGNFPFIDPFVAIDVDRDGQISRDELTSYFVKANKDSVAFRKGFKHEFHETTFLTPTTCSHCGKLLWGLIRQGWKCRDCGLSVHACCKANAVAECRRRSSVLPDWLNPRSLNGSFRDRLFQNKRGDTTRVRTVSTVVGGSNDCSPTDVIPEDSVVASGRVTAASARENGNNHHLPLHRTTQQQQRPHSESTECYASRGLSPEDEHPVVSLASEEVFEDDNSSENIENGISSL